MSDRDARLLAHHLVEVEQHLAIDAARMAWADERSGKLCNAARARVAEDLELVSAALERSLSAR